MLFKQIRCGGDRNFGYLLADEANGQAVAIDPSPNPEPMLAFIRENNLTVEYVFATHNHADHTAGIALFRRYHSARSVFHVAAGTGEIRVEDGQVISAGSMKIEVLHTPGHTPDAICLLAGGHLITGDTLFVGKVGGTSGEEAARSEFNSLNRLMSLPDQVSVWPGHDYGQRPSSTIGEERKTNPFCLRLDDFTNFIWLKEHWAEYKLEHGIQ